jgi:hypothetical protein
MSNPWLKKNPFMSMWLSGANAVAGAARGRATAELNRQTKAASAAIAREFVTASLPPAKPAKCAARTRKRR